MFNTFRTLMVGASARADERLKDIYSIELIEQKIREAEASLKAAKLTLASLIQRERSETGQIDGPEGRITDLTERTKAALVDGREALAGEGAQAIANLENEMRVRSETRARIEARILQLRQSVEAASRRIIDLKQGAIAAKAVRREQDMQRRLNRTVTTSSAINEAEELIGRVMSRDDPFEQSQILSEIDASLDGNGAAERMAQAGYGTPEKTTATDVLARLKS